MAHDPVARTLDAADDLCVRMMNEITMPGLGVGIVRGGEVVYARGFGMADAGRGVPFTPDTVFKIGSSSKTFVAVSIMQLEEQGLLDLDDPVAEHMRGFSIHVPKGSPQPTIRQAMTHTAGVGEWRELRGLVRRGGRLGWPADRPLPTYPDLYRNGLKVEVPPGTKWAYANHMIAALDQMVQEVSGMPFDAYLREHILDPLGMDSTDLHRGHRHEGRVALGYKNDMSKGLQPNKDVEMVIGGAGSILSTINDMNAYMLALLAGGSGPSGQILKPESVEQLFTSQGVTDERLSYRQGLSFFMQDFSGHKIAYHGGGRTGYITMMMLAPDDDLGVVAFVNASRGGSYQVARHLLCQLLDIPVPAAAVDALNLPERADLWGQLVGIYRPLPGLNSAFRPIALSGGEFEILVHDAHLAIRGLRKGLALPIRLKRSDPEDPLVYRAAIGGGFSRDVWEFVFKPGDAGRAQSFEAFISVPMEFRRRPDATSLRKARTVSLRTAAAGAVVGAAAGARYLLERSR